MSVDKVVLFVSSSSKVCVPCLNFIKANKMGVSIVRLDTAEVREIAATGKEFQVVSVPSMVVFYEDGNLQMFIGVDKIMTVLKNLVSPPRQPEFESHDGETQYSSPVNMYETDPYDQPPSGHPYVPKRNPRPSRDAFSLDVGDRQPRENSERGRGGSASAASAASGRNHSRRIVIDSDSDTNVRGVNVPDFSSPDDFEREEAEVVPIIRNSRNDSSPDHGGKPKKGKKKRAKATVTFDDGGQSVKDRIAMMQRQFSEHIGE